MENQREITVTLTLAEDDLQKLEGLGLGPVMTCEDACRAMRDAVDACVRKDAAVRALLDEYVTGITPEGLEALRDIMGREELKEYGYDTDEIMTYD